jgi:hypothetical protein
MYNGSVVFVKKKMDQLYSLIVLESKLALHSNAHRYATSLLLIFHSKQ